MVNRTREADLARRAWVADSHWTRLRGLLGRPRLRGGEGLLLMPSRGVHTWGMRYPIDVVFVNEEGRVLALYPELEPWRRTRVHREATRAYEFPGGTIESAHTRPGDRLELVPWRESDDRDQPSKES